MAGPRALRVIIAYKVIKGGALVLAGISLGIALALGASSHLHELAVTLREYVTAALAVEVAELLLKISTPGHLVLTSVAIGLDGVVGMIEAWLLHRRRRWAIWLVVIATSALVPWEIVELIRHFRLLRLALLILNIAVAIYLGWQASKHLAPEQRPV